MVQILKVCNTSVRLLVLQLNKKKKNKQKIISSSNRVHQEFPIDPK